MDLTVVMKSSGSNEHGITISDNEGEEFTSNLEVTLDGDENKCTTRRDGSDGRPYERVPLE
jgi:hypothetical protein